MTLFWLWGFLTFAVSTTSSSHSFVFWNRYPFSLPARFKLHNHAVKSLVARPSGIMNIVYFMKSSRFHADSLCSKFMHVCRIWVNDLTRGGLTARSGTEFTWSLQLRNSAKWDWVQIFLENKYGGECRRGRTMSFRSVLSFPAYKYQETVSLNFFNGPFGHQEGWSMNSPWVTSGSRQV